MNGHTPNVWISDRFTPRSKSMAPHIKPVWRIWRATRPMRWSMDRTICPAVFDLARDIASSPPRPIASKKRELEKQTRRPSCAATECDLARQLQAKIGRAQDQLLIFCDYPGEVEATNQRLGAKAAALRDPAKSYNGYRAMWAAQAEADVRTTVDTARLKGANPFQTILDTLV